MHLGWVFKSLVREVKLRQDLLWKSLCWELGAPRFSVAAGAGLEPGGLRIMPKHSCGDALGSLLLKQREKKSRTCEHSPASLVLQKFSRLCYSCSMKRITRVALHE